MTEEQSRALQRATIELAKARRKIRKLFASVFPPGSTVIFKRGHLTYHAVVTGYSEDGEFILAKAGWSVDTRYQIKPTDILEGA
ncbi:hypothetical protein OLZ32_27965 [Rhizobium sp. 1AS11]|uniref:hypothetical protein n=1 Tax=Rhizobium acaciae TaxID=2989736 RepID=UPI0022231953|nr:hypothetical protein [Rhizobium acaciae]MCW1412190.1 hypothetical protein [Rhizobium acaciae]MCW1744205.1 hypothetical protein [Rhizobium acaciae]